MTDAESEFTGTPVAHAVLFAIGVVVFGIFILYDNHHPRARHLVYFLTSALCWGFAILILGQVLGVA